MVVTGEGAAPVVSANKGEGTAPVVGGGVLNEELLAAEGFDPAAAFAICRDGLRTFLDDAFGQREHHVVLGLSGGIDSALVAAIAVAALGVDRVHGITLPGPHTSGGTRSDAEVLAENLGISFGAVAISPAAEACVAALDEGLGLDVTGTIAAQNIQARLRMVMLMAVSNARGWTVLNTGNLSEACMGYCTLYGDTVGAYDPIGGLLKTEVYALSRWINEHAAELYGEGCTEAIPEATIRRAPSAELADGQTDEDSLGITYAVLDAVLARLLAGESAEEVVAAGVATAEQVDAVVARMQANAFKKAWFPPHPAVLHG